MLKFSIRQTTSPAITSAVDQHHPVMVTRNIPKRPSPSSRSSFKTTMKRSRHHHRSIKDPARRRRNKFKSSTSNTTRTNTADSSFMTRLRLCHRSGTTKRRMSTKTNQSSSRRPHSCLTNRRPSVPSFVPIRSSTKATVAFT